MAGAKKGAPRTSYNTEGVGIDSGIELPQNFRDSKYPWGALLLAIAANPDKTQSFFIPTEDEAQANTARQSIHSSGQSYLSSRPTGLTAKCRVMQRESDGVYGVRCTAVPVRSSGDDSAE